MSPAWLPVATTTQVSTTATAAKGGDLQLTMETINYQGTGSFSQPPPALDDWMPTTPLVSLPPGFQSLLLPDADRSLTGFRPVDCRLLLRVDDAFSGRPLAQPADLLGKQTCYSRLSPSRRLGIGPRVLGTVVPSLSWSCFWF